MLHCAAGFTLWHDLTIAGCVLHFEVVMGHFRVDKLNVLPVYMSHHRLIVVNLFKAFVGRILNAGAPSSHRLEITAQACVHSAARVQGVL